MKQKNFPARKLKRQLVAKGEDINSEKNVKLLDQARNVRTKKVRVV